MIPVLSLSLLYGLPWLAGILMDSVIKKKTFVTVAIVLAFAG